LASVCPVAATLLLQSTSTLACAIAIVVADVIDGATDVVSAFVA
jgi:hypothetical protein